MEGEEEEQREKKGEREREEKGEEKRGIPMSCPRSSGRLAELVAKRHIRGTEAGTLRAPLSHPLVPSQMDLTDTPPTSPATQAGTPQLYRHGSNQGMSATRHPEFYYTDPTLMDPVILQVRLFLLPWLVSEC